MTMNFKNFPLGEFIKQARADSCENTTDMVRLIQRAAFQMLWSRYRFEGSQLFVYKNIGQMVEIVLKGMPGANTQRDRRFREKIQNQPVTGQIGSTSHIHDDFCFMILSIDNELYLILDNHAVDSGLRQVYIYDNDIECFVESEDRTLLDFLILNEVRIPQRVAA